MNFLRNTHIQKRLLVSFILLSLLPVLIIGSLLYVKASQAIHDKIEYYSAETLNQISQNVDRELERLNYDSIEIMFSENVQHTLSNYESLSEWDLLMVTENLQETLVKKFSFLHDVSDVIIYTNSKDKILAYGDEGSNILNYQEPIFNQLIERAQDKKGIPIWIASNYNDEIHRVNLLTKDKTSREGIVLTRMINSIDNGEPIGTILIRTNELYFSQIYNEMDLSKQKILILNELGQVISTNEDKWLVGEYFYDTKFIKNIMNTDNNNSFTYELDENYLVSFDKVINADWYIISFTPDIYLTEETNRILIFTLLIGLVTITLAIVMSYIISSSISTPLKSMIKTMKEVENGQLDVEIVDHSKDELAKVSGHFNDMIYEVRLLLIETKTKEKEKRIAELSALQAQINPHFLSNTLNSVKWLATIQKADNIENIITSLIELLHLTMGKDDDFITIEEEMTYLKHYLNIQAYRYYDEFKVQFDIEEGIKDVLIPRFLIQPLVENALIHGIESKDEQGLIIIKAWHEKNMVHYSVMDNGVGVSDSVIKKIMLGEVKPKSSFNGIGLNNVRERVKLYFGEEYDLLIESIEGVFTRIEIYYPITIKGGDKHV